MGKRGVEILDLDVNQLIEMLNAALSDEMFAFYQYWVGARVMEGPMRGDIEKELLVHADQELNHAAMLADRIVQLNGTPVLSPQEWYDKGECKYARPDDPYIEKVLGQNLDAERCAIDTYKKIIEFTRDKDYTTYDIAKTILGEEIEHEQEIEDWLTDIERMKENLKLLQCT